MSYQRLGLLFGPVIGSLLNLAFGYSIPFFVIAIFFVLAEIPIYLQMPPDSSLKSFEKKKRLPIGKAFTSIKVNFLNIFILGYCHNYECNVSYLWVYLFQSLLR